MDLRALLSIPYLLEAEAVETEPGRLAHSPCLSRAARLHCRRGHRGGRAEGSGAAAHRNDRWACGGGQATSYSAAAARHIRSAMDRERSRIVGPGRRALGSEVGAEGAPQYSDSMEKDMLSHEDNERLVRVGKGTPLGELFRLYWIPFLPSADLVKRRAAEAHPAARRRSGRLQGYRGPRRSGRPGLSASRRAADLRAKRGLRPALRLSRLEVRRDAAR